MICLSKKEGEIRKKIHVSAYFHKNNHMKEKPEDNKVDHLQEVGMVQDERDIGQSDTRLSVSF